MKKDPFIDRLSELLNDASVDGRSNQKIKKSVMHQISASASNRRDEALIAALKKVYKRPTNSLRISARNVVVAEIKEMQKKKVGFDILHFGLNFIRKSFALGFSFALLAVTVLAPLQYRDYQAVIPAANAAYLECVGSVILNGDFCKENEIIEIVAGDSIETKERAKATIFYTNYSVVRLEEKTKASLDQDDDEQINVVNGEVWVNSPSESSSSTVKVSTTVLKAKIPQGSAGVLTKRNTTELISESAIVEVQIDGPTGNTDILTIAPEEKVVKVRKSTTASRIRTHKLTEKQMEWVYENKIKDVAHLQQVKRKTLEDQEQIAGGLPGGVPDYVGKLSQKARTVFVWDESVRAELKLTQLDELFSETIVLLEKGDQTTALYNFEVYSEKLASLIETEFDKLSVIETVQVQEKAVRLLEEHVRIVSPYSIEDKQYVLKDRMNQLTLNLDTNPLNSLAQKMKGSVTQSKIAEAHKNVSEGNIEEAEILLKEATTSLTKDSVSETSLPLLTDISDKSDLLQPLVKALKRQTVVQLKQKELPEIIKQIETDVIKGSAYNPNDRNEEDSEKEEILSSVIVGQAIKPEDSSL